MPDSHRTARAAGQSNMVFDNKHTMRCADDGWKSTSRSRKRVETGWIEPRRRRRPPWKGQPRLQTGLEPRPRRRQHLRRHPSGRHSPNRHRQSGRQLDFTKDKKKLRNQRRRGRDRCRDQMEIATSPEETQPNGESRRKCRRHRHNQHPVAVRRTQEKVGSVGQKMTEIKTGSMIPEVSKFPMQFRHSSRMTGARRRCSFTRMEASMQMWTP